MVMTPNGFAVAALPDSETDRLPREPLDLDELRKQLDGAEAELAAAKQRVWRLRVQIQDEELRLRWAERERASKAWAPPEVVVEAHRREPTVAKEASNRKEASNGRGEPATTVGRSVSRQRRRPSAADVPSQPAAWSGPPPRQIQSIAALSKQRRRKKEQ